MPVLSGSFLAAVRHGFRIIDELAQSTFRQVKPFCREKMLYFNHLHVF
jgi:hypothetical protein